MPLEAPVTTAVRGWVLVMRPSCRPILPRCARDHRGGRRFGTRQPRPGRLGVVRRRRLLGLRRLAARHQQHGRADGRPRPPPADRARRRRAARLLRQQVRHRLRHQVDAGLEAQGLEEERRQAGAQRRADEGARRRHGGPARQGPLRVGQGPRRPRAQRGGRQARQRRRVRLPARRRARCRARASPAAAPPTRAATVGQVEQEPDLFSDLADQARRWSRPTRSTSSPWSGRC